jgi:hypothetical protein
VPVLFLWNQELAPIVFSFLEALLGVFSCVSSFFMESRTDTDCLFLFYGIKN